MTMRSLTVPLGLMWLLLSGGCKQALGERCQIDADCEDGLYCELAGNSVAMGGSCRSRTVTQPPDLSVPPDLSMPDLSMPDLIREDISPTDGMDGGG